MELLVTFLCIQTTRPLETDVYVILTFCRKKKTHVPVYKRLSAHITLDLPDIPDALKETANKVESMMSQNPRYSSMY